MRRAGGDCSAIAEATAERLRAVLVNCESISGGDWDECRRFLSMLRIPPPATRAYLGTVCCYAPSDARFIRR